MLIKCRFLEAGQKLKFLVRRQWGFWATQILQSKLSSIPHDVEFYSKLDSTLVVSVGWPACRVVTNKTSSLALS
jgi:hypothetical protein